MTPLWTPSEARVQAARLTAFTQLVNARHGLDLASYDQLHAWSIADLPAFWQAVWDFAELVQSRPAHAVLAQDRMPGARWFEGARLNFAENLLRHGIPGAPGRDRPALIAVHESGAREPFTHGQLHDAVARLADWLAQQGVGPGDRVAAFLPNRPEAVIGMLATTSLGAIWSSCSPDFGFKGVLDRFGQIEPKILIATDGTVYGGKRFPTVDRVAEVAAAIPSIQRVLTVPVLGEDIGPVRAALPWSAALDRPVGPLAFAQLPFDHPLVILYSSGTTGVPKCIVHSAGGTLLQHAKELILHSDLGPEDVLFYFTTTGWMMWNWLSSGLLTGAALVLFDGSPGHPDLHVLWRMAAAEGVTHFGTSPKFLGICAGAGLRPGEAHDLSALRVLLSTGSPLSAELFAWTYQAVGADLQLASISGGTDIVSCFMLGAPTEPVYAGEIQKPGLGMAVEAWDEDGAPVRGAKGELVCVRPFVAMPVGFWDDPDGARYRDAYFSAWPGVWHHGDYIEITPRNGVIVYGRSDATLNPGGVRIGTAEIDRQVEQVPEVADCLVVGQRWGDDVRVVLFVVLREGATLDDDLRARIRTQIRTHTTPRHVPARILEVPEIPRTLSGKKVELAVTRVLHGEAVKNTDAMANPGALEHFRDRPELAR